MTRIEHGDWVVVCDGRKALILTNMGDHMAPNLRTPEVRREHAAGREQGLFPLPVEALPEWKRYRPGAACRSHGVAPCQLTHARGLAIRALFMSRYIAGRDRAPTVLLIIRASQLLVGRLHCCGSAGAQSCPSRYLGSPERFDPHQCRHPTVGL
jgi:hypothetical protein